MKRNHLPAFGLLCALVGGDRLRCTTQPPTLDCSSTQLVVRVPRGTCGAFTNNCVDHAWVTGDDWEFDNTPNGVTLQTSQTPTLQRTLCVAATAPLFVNAPVAFTYSRAGEYGNGTLLLSDGEPLRASVEGPPGAIDPGQSVVLKASATGGTPPYDYAWSPSLDLSAANVPDPAATPLNGVTYTVSVTDADGTVSMASVTVVVNGRLSVTANPTIVRPGEPSQLTAVMQGGAPPFTFLWAPAGPLNDATSDAPVATPQASADFQVTVTDAAGAQTSGTVHVEVVAGGPKACFTLTWLTKVQLLADASCSTGAVSYAFWEHYSGNPSDPPNQVQVTPAFAWFSDPGTARVQVADAAGRTDSTTLVIPPHP